LPMTVLFPYTTLFRSVSGPLVSSCSLMTAYLFTSNVLSGTVRAAEPVVVSIDDKLRAGIDALFGEDHDGRIGALGDALDLPEALDRKSTRLNSSHVSI